MFHSTSVLVSFSFHFNFILGDASDAILPPLHGPSSLPRRPAPLTGMPKLPARRRRSAQNASVAPLATSSPACPLPAVGEKPRNQTGTGVAVVLRKSRVVLHSTERDPSNGMESCCLISPDIPPGEPPLGIHIFGPNTGGGPYSPKPPLPPQVVVVQKGV